MGVHPTSSVWEGKVYESPVHHEIALMCDDIEKNVAELKAKGAEFKGEVKDHGYGLVITLVVPAAGDMLLYQPRHKLAYDL